MDPESWRMAATNFKEQREMTVPRTLHVNHTRYLPTERFGKRTAVVMVNDEPAEMEGRFLKVDGKPSYKRSLNSVDQGEMKQKYSEERMIVMSKHSVNKWAYQVPDSFGHRKNVGRFSCGNNAQNSKAHYGLECKRFPTVKRDITRTFIPKQESANFQLLREDVKISASSCIDTRDLIQEVPGEQFNVKTEPILVDDDDEDDVESEGSNHYPISFHPSHRKTMGPNIVHYESGTGKQLNRNNASGQASIMCTEERVRQKMLSNHRILYRDLPSASGEITHDDNTVNSIQRMKFKGPSSNESKGQHSVLKQKEKSAGTSTFRRFLLIDSKGLPYTVVVEESKTTKDGPSNESFTEIRNAAASKPVAPRKVYKCPVCFRIFEYLSYLQRHSIAHSQQKPHICKICGKAFKRTSHLTRHKYTHFGGKPTQCQICHRRFRDIGELTRHQLSHTEERPYQCDVCQMCFGEQSTLQHHMLAKH